MAESETVPARRKVLAALFYGVSSVAIMGVNKTVLTTYKCVYRRAVTVRKTEKNNKRGEPDGSG